MKANGMLERLGFCLSTWPQDLFLCTVSGYVCSSGVTRLWDLGAQSLWDTYIPRGTNLRLPVPWKPRFRNCSSSLSEPSTGKEATGPAPVLAEKLNFTFWCNSLNAPTPWRSPGLICSFSLKDLSGLDLATASVGRSGGSLVSGISHLGSLPVGRVSSGIASDLDAEFQVSVAVLISPGLLNGVPICCRPWTVIIFHATIFFPCHYL